jgi:hypothetical protein
VQYMAVYMAVFEQRRSLGLTNTGPFTVKASKELLVLETSVSGTSGKVCL